MFLLDLILLDKGPIRNQTALHLNKDEEANILHTIGSLASFAHSRVLKSNGFRHSEPPFYIIFLRLAE